MHTTSVVLEYAFILAKHIIWADERTYTGYDRLRHQVMGHPRLCLHHYYSRSRVVFVYLLLHVFLCILASTFY